MPSGFASICIANITSEGAELIKSAELPCAGAEQDRVHLRVWATLDKLVPKQVEYGTDTVLDPALARAQLVQHAIEKDMWLDSAQDLCYGDPGTRGAVHFAAVLNDPEKIRIGPRRLVGDQDGVLTHIEENKDGKIIGVSNPKLTIYTKKRVEIRAATWKLLESVLQLAQALADHRNSDTNLSLHIAAMVPFASDAIEAHRKSDTSVKFDFGTMAGITINQVYDLTVGIAQVLYVSVRSIKDTNKEGMVILNRTIAKVTAADPEGRVRLCSMDSSMFASLGNVSQVLKVEPWQTDEQALVPANLKEFSLTPAGHMARLGDQSAEHNPLTMLREMDAAELRNAYTPHAQKKAARITTLQNDISAIQEKKLADLHGVQYKMPIGSCTLILIRDPANPSSDIQFHETVYHGQSVYDWSTSVIGTNVDEDDEEWVQIAAAQLLTTNCHYTTPCPGPYIIFKSRGNRSIPLKAAVLTHMRDYMEGNDLANLPQELYATVDFTGTTAIQAANKILKLAIGTPANETAGTQGSKRFCAPEDVIEEYLKSQLQRAAVITATFAPDIKLELRRLTIAALTPGRSDSVIEILNYLDNDPDDPLLRHSTLDDYDTATVITALEMAIASPFDKSGGTALYDSGERTAIMKRLDSIPLRARTKLVFDYFSTYSNALAETGPATPAQVTNNIAGTVIGSASNSPCDRHGTGEQLLPEGWGNAVPTPWVNEDGDGLEPTMKDSQNAEPANTPPEAAQVLAAGSTDEKQQRSQRSETRPLESSLEISLKNPVKDSSINLLIRMKWGDMNNTKSGDKDPQLDARGTINLGGESGGTAATVRDCRTWTQPTAPHGHPLGCCYSHQHAHYHGSAARVNIPKPPERNMRTTETALQTVLWPTERFPEKDPWMGTQYEKVKQKVSLRVAGTGTGPGDLITWPLKSLRSMGSLLGWTGSRASSIAWGLRTTILATLGHLATTYLENYGAGAWIHTPVMIACLTMMIAMQLPRSAKMRWAMQRLGNLGGGMREGLCALGKSKTLMLLLLTMLVTSAGAESHTMYEQSALQSIFPYMLPATAASLDAYDCAGRWVTSLGEAEWEDLEDTGGEQYGDDDPGWDQTYYGDTMLKRSDTTGLRVLAQNAGRTIFKTDQPEAGIMKLHGLLENMTKNSVDVAVIHEPGMYARSDEYIARILGDPWRHVAVRRDEGDRGGGTLIVYKASIEPAMHKTNRTSAAVTKMAGDRSQGNALFDRDRLVTLEMANPRIADPAPGQPERKDRMLILAMYGYNTTSVASSSNHWGGKRESAEGALGGH